MDKRALIDNITVSLSTILLLLGMEQYFKQYLYEFALPMIMIGLLILLLGRRIVKDIDVSFSKRIITNSVGLMLLITGLDYFLEQQIHNYGWAYIVIALVIYHYHRDIGDALGV